MRDMDRNNIIYDRREHGEKLQTIADDYGLSRERVRQIHVRVRRLREKACKGASPKRVAALERAREARAEAVRIARASGLAVSDLGIDARGMNALARHGFEYVWQVLAVSPDLIREIPGVGRKTFNMLRQAMVDETGKDWLRLQSAPDDVIWPRGPSLLADAERSKQVEQKSAQAPVAGAHRRCADADEPRYGHHAAAVEHGRAVGAVRQRVLHADGHMG